MSKIELDKEHGLLHSGATHALRGRFRRKGRQPKRLYTTAGGVILQQDETVQNIVPMSVWTVSTERSLDEA